MFFVMKKFFTFLTVFGLICFLGGLLFYRWIQGPGFIVIGDKNLQAISWPENIDFAGEKVPLEDFYVREAWEREFLILLDAPHQSILYLKRAEKYLPYIEKELAQRNLPDDLKYIAVAESALREVITSSAGASGIWQFMPATARQYGLQVDGEIDERLDFEKATSSALDYLSFLYDRFENWSLSSAAYNAGQGRILGHLVDQQVVSYYDLLMNAETSRYLFRILAIKEIMNHPEKYQIRVLEKDQYRWPDYETKTVGEVLDLTSWAQEQGTHLRAIKELNPWILKNTLPPGEWEIKIPR